MSPPSSKSAPTILLGAHMSIAGGTFLAIERAAQAGCTVLQIFVKNNNRWQGRPLSAEEAEEFKRRRSCSRLARIVAHDCYLINLASPQEALWSRSITALAEEVQRCARLGVDLLDEHIGKGQIGTAGFACIMNDRRLAAVPKLIETPKGKTLKEDRRNLRLLRSLVVSAPSASLR